MTPRRRKYDVGSEKEAIMAISAGVTYFAVKKPIKTVLVLLLMGFGPAYVAFDYFTSYRATIKEAEPIAKPTVFHAVQQRTDEIIINGKLYGYSRSGVKAWVLADADAILVFNEKTGEVSKVEIPGFSKRKR